jgi:D-xylonolactonase
VTDLESLVWGFGLLEGPRVDDGGRLYFADVPNGGVFCLHPGGDLETVVPKRRGVGGIALHADGGLVIGGRDVSHVRDGVSRVLHRFDAPGINDLMADPAGRVVVGTLRTDPFADGGARRAGEAWRIDAEGVATELYGGVLLSNGIGFSPDGTVLYHADTASNGVWAHDYGVDGAVSGRRFVVRSEDLQPDGLAVDEHGVLWIADVSGAGAVRAFDPDGTEIARVPVPARMVTSVCFGGADRRDLYIVTADNTDHPERAGTVFRTRVDVPGLPAPLVRI